MYTVQYVADQESIDKFQDPKVEKKGVPNDQEKKTTFNIVDGSVNQYVSLKVRRILYGSTPGHT